jgi:RNA polymerase-binding transcription factor DksA
MSDDNLVKWSKDLMKGINEVLKSFDDRQNIFNLAMFNLLDDKQKEKLIADLDKQKDKKTEEIQAMIKKFKVEVKG